MKLDRCSELVVQESVNPLLKNLNGANTPEVSATLLGHQYGCIPSDLVGQHPIAEL